MCASKIQNPDSKVEITLIVAMSRNHVIGRKGELPWRLPADLQRFKQRTIGHAVIMGRKTWDTLKGRPLPQRTNIVITRDRSLLVNGIMTAPSLEAALDAARNSCPDAREVFIAGGAEIYRLALPGADRIDLTLVDATVDAGDAFFPPFEQDPSWRLVRQEAHAADDRHAHAFGFLTYERHRDFGAR